MKRRRHKQVSAPKSAGKPEPAGDASPESPAKPGVSRRKLWLFRAAGVIFSPLVFLALLETGLRIGGIGHPMSFFLPAKINGKDVLIQNDRFAWRFFGPEIARQPWPLAMPEAKPAGTVRVFVFGESAAFGDPQPEFGLPRMLEAILSLRYPGARFEVVNVAMTAINSHAILPIARDSAKRDGDIWVVYMGNNEVVGPYGAGTVFGSQAGNLNFIRWSLALKATRTGQWLGNLLRPRQPATKSEWGGMLMFVKNQVRQSDPGMARVYSNFERNLADIINAGARSGARIVVSSVAVNLKDCAPFASLHRADLSATELTEWERIYQKGTEAEQAGRAADAVEQFRQAEKIDGTFAELQFRWGRCSMAQGDDVEARRRFAMARDLDALRFRADGRINEIIRAASTGKESQGIRFADVEQAFAQSSPRGITGEEFIYEHVHLSFEGNYLAALTIAAEVARLLPPAVAGNNSSNRSWPSADDCAKRLAWMNWNRYEGETAILARLNDPPFTTQLNHGEQVERLRRQVERNSSATQPAALRQADSLFGAAIAANPDDWVLHKNRAQLRQRLGEFAGAAESWRRVTAALPQFVEAWQGLGLALAGGGREDDAVAAFRTALEKDPLSVDARMGLAQIFARKNRNDEAIRHYEEILKLKPYWGPAHFGLGKSLEATGKTNEALPHFKQSLQNRLLTPAAMNALAEFCFARGWFAEAATNFTDSLRLNPSDPATHVNLGVTLAQLGRHPEAMAHYAEAVRLNPLIPEAHYRLGFELGMQDKHAEAIKEFAEALRLKPDLLEARLNMAIGLMQLQRNTEALEQFQEVLRKDPSNAIALEKIRQLRGN